MEISTKPKDLATTKAVQDLDTAIYHLKQKIAKLEQRIQTLENA